MKNLLIFFLMGLVITSCNDEDKVTKLYSYPEWQKDKYLKGTSNSLFIFHYGHIKAGLLPKRELKPSGMPKSMPYALNIGGIAILSDYLRIIKERFENQAIFISHGGLRYFESDEVKKRIISTAIKELPIDALLLSKDDVIKTNSKQEELLSGLPWYNSNILSIKTGEPTEIYGSEPYKVIKTPSLAMGLIGTTSYKLLSPLERNEISGFYFQDPVTTILRTKNQLAKAGVNLIALYYEGPLSCTQKLMSLTTPFQKLPKIESICEKDSDLMETLKRLPPNSIDIVFTNARGFSGALFQDIPVLSLNSPSDYIYGIKLVAKDSQVDLKNSLLLKPIKLCHQIFVATQDCVFDLNDEDLNEERFELMEKSSFGVIKARFLGHEISEDSKIMGVLNGK